MVCHTFESWRQQRFGKFVEAGFSGSHDEVAMFDPPVRGDVTLDHTAIWRIGHDQLGPHALKQSLIDGGVPSISHEQAVFANLPEVGHPREWSSISAG